MVNVLVDKLSYYAILDNNVLVEGYDGFMVEETLDGINYVLYKDIIDNKENDRRFILPRNSFKNFLSLSRRYENFFEKQKFLFNLLVRVEKMLISRNEENLHEICNEVYSVPDNYIHFVAMNMTKGNFFSIAKEKILNSQNLLELN